AIIENQVGRRHGQSQARRKFVRPKIAYRSSARRHKLGANTFTQRPAARRLTLCEWRAEILPSLGQKILSPRRSGPRSNFSQMCRKRREGKPFNFRATPKRSHSQ